MLLLDEPFAGSDADSLAGIADVIRAVRDRGHGVILVDHNVDLVASLVDRMMLLDSGRVAFVGTAEACLASEQMRRVYFGAALDPTTSGEDAGRGGETAGDQRCMTSRSASSPSTTGGPSPSTASTCSAPGGAVTCLVGPNGAGKSSIILAAYGAVAATARSCSTASRSPAGVRRPGPPRAGDRAAGPPAVPPADGPREHAGLRRHAEAAGAAVDGALDRFPILRERAKRLAGILSGGEQQMLVVSRALMTEPRAILLDEIMTGLAPRIVESLVDVVRDLSASGIAILMAEPSIHAVRGVLDRGYVMVRGRIVDVGEEGGVDLDDRYIRAMGIAQAVPVAEPSERRPVLSVVVVMEVEPGRRDEVEQHIARFCDEVAAADPGTETYIVVRALGDGNENTVAMFEEFTDEAAVAAHGEMAAELTETLRPLLRQVTVVMGPAVSRK